MGSRHRDASATKQRVTAFPAGSWGGRRAPLPGALPPQPHLSAAASPRRFPGSSAGLGAAPRQPRAAPAVPALPPEAARRVLPARRGRAPRRRRRGGCTQGFSPTGAEPPHRTAGVALGAFPTPLLVWMGLRARRLPQGTLPRGRAGPSSLSPHPTPRLHGRLPPRSEGRQKVGKPFQEPLSLGKLRPNPKSWLERNGGQPGPPLSPITVLVTASRNADSGAEPNGPAGAPKGPQQGHRRGQQEEEPPCHHLWVAAHPAWGHGGTEPPRRSPVPPSEPWPQGRSADCRGWRPPSGRPQNPSLISHGETRAAGRAARGPAASRGL